jgi:hypothetical protein
MVEQEETRDNTSTGQQQATGTAPARGTPHLKLAINNRGQSRVYTGELPQSPPGLVAVQPQKPDIMDAIETWDLVRCKSVLADIFTGIIG